MLAGAATPAHTAPGVCLSRVPAPPQAIANDGTEIIRFDWLLDFQTTCSSPYTFQIISPGGTQVASYDYDCGLTPIADSLVFNPENLPCGCYYGLLTFYSDWCAGTPRAVEKQALVAFLVSAQAQFRVCKRWDLNGDGDVTDDPPLSGWNFTVQRPLGTVVAMGTTDIDGCVTFNVDVECDAATTVYICEALPPGWQQTTQGGQNPFPVVLWPGNQNPDVLVGNWQPIYVTGYKLLDQAPWPWTDPHFVGPAPEFVQNPPEWEPMPPCLCPVPPDPCDCPVQPGQEGLPGVTVRLYDNTDPISPVLLATTITDANGAYVFGPLQWRQDFRVEVDDPAPVPPACDTGFAEYGLPPWSGGYVGTVASSPWPSPVVSCPNIDFENFHELQILLPEPTIVGQEYGCNFFWNNQPCRLWGMFCDQAMREIPNLSLGIGKDGATYPTPAVNPAANGFYIVPELSVEPAGIRPGVYRLTPPVPADPVNQQWEVTVYCATNMPNGVPIQMTNGFVDVQVPHSTDVRVDFCLRTASNNRQCFLPVTFTRDGWRQFSDPDSPIVPGGMLYNKFRLAFASFNYFGTVFSNKVIIGKDKTITFEGTTSGLTRLMYFLAQEGPCGKLDRSYTNPTTTPGGTLASELLALQMNTAYNNRRLMPRTSGYDLEKYKLAKGLLKGKTVREVRNMANAVLGGATPASFGLPNCDALVEIIAAINGNYAFANFDTFIDNGYLIPNRPFGLPDPPAPVVVP